MRLPVLVLPVLGILALAGCQTTGARTGAVKTASNVSQSERLIKLADDIEARGESATAIALYQRATTMPDAGARAYVKVGGAYMRAGYPSEAVAAYRQALDRSPNDPQAMLGLGSAMIETGDIDAGIRALAQAAPLVNTSSAYNRLGVAQTFAGQTQAAQATFGQAARLSPGDLDIEINMALAAALEDDAGTAIGLAQNVVASPAAQLHQKRNAVVVYGLVGRAAEIKSTPPTGLATAEVDKLLARARTIRAKSGVVARAKALGSIMG